MGEKKLVYERGLWTVHAWVERASRYDGDRTDVGVYVAIARAGTHVRTERARTTPAPWWLPWLRSTELTPTVTRAVALIDEQERLETNAEATLEAVTEAMQLLP